MRLGIDARMLQHSGIGRYVQGLLAGLVRTGFDGTVRVVTTPAARAAVPEGAGFEIVTCDIPIYGLGEHLRLPRRFAGCDLVHVPHYNVGLGLRRPYVVTIHDLIHLQRPHDVRRALVGPAARLVLQSAVRRAAHVVAVSAHTRDGLVRLLGVDPARVTVIPEGPAAHFVPPQARAVADFRARRGLPARFVLYVGLLRPHKNVVRLVEAFARCTAAHAGGVALLVRGTPDARYPEILEAMRTVPPPAHVALLDPVPDAEMPLLYAAATLLVQPSLDEGFGLPPLEAMACGTPVVAARAGALPEVLGDAALFVDPTDPASIAGGIARVLAEPTLRDDLVRRGRERAARWDADAAAQAMRTVYRQALGALR